MNTKQLRNSILSLSISGRLVPQDPNDEPASELLKRINPKAAPLNPDDAPFTLPDSWCWCMLGDIFVHNTGKALNNSANKEGTLLPYLTTSNVYWNRFDFTEVRKMYFTESELEKFTIRKGDLLVCEGGDIGRSAIWNSDENICIQNHIHRLRAYIPLCTMYFYYVLYLFKHIGLIGGKGMAIQGLSSRALHKITIPLPPLAEQERIVKEVERWFANIEQLERSQEALGKAARQTKRHILSLAISGRLVPQDPNNESAIALLRRINPKFTPQPTDEPLPQGWTATTMSMLCELTDGEKIQGKEMINLDAKYLRGQNEGNTLKEGRLIPANSLLILVDGENSGEVFRAPIEGYQGSTFKRLVINDNMYEPFVLQVINSHRKRLRENKVGAAIPHLDKKLFKDLTVLVPPLAEQERIVQKVEELFAVLDALQ